MKIRDNRFLILSALLLTTQLAGSCTTSTTTETPTTQPTATATPGSEVELPTETMRATETAEPSPTAENEAPVISGLVDQTVSDGERFEHIKLSDYVTDADSAKNQIHWEISGNQELLVRVLGDNLIVTPPNAEWIGSETLHFEACDPQKACTTMEITFSVISENDAPIITIADQFVLPGETFPPIDLLDAAQDEDHTADQLVWNITNDGDLKVEITDGIASVTSPNTAWVGLENLHFEACDPEGACGVKDVYFLVMDDVDVESTVTYVGNDGFLITAGDKKVLIDALFEGFSESYSLPPEVIDQMVNAQPPFDGLDLILATHNHADHFDAGLVRSALVNSPETSFVGPDEATAMLPSPEELRDRIIPINLSRGQSTSMYVNGIGIEAFHISHGGGILNLGYIITMGGHRFFHTGDIATQDAGVAYLQNYGLPEKNLDVAFVPHFLLYEEEDRAVIEEGIQSEYLVPMHYAYTTPNPNYNLMATYFPDAILFYEEMESWVVP